MVNRTLLQRNKSPRKSLPLARRLAIENLEDRRVLSADFGSAFAIGPGAVGWDVAKDGAGNSLVLGTVSTGFTVDVDPGPGVVNLSYVSGGQNHFVAKYDVDGNFIWVSRMGGSVGNFGPRLAAGSDGAVYVTGSFRDSAIFGSTTVTSLGGEDPFVTKLDSNGNILWARQLTSGTGNDNGNSVVVDGSGNAYVIGELHSSVTDTFITKLDPSGTALWTKQFGSSTSAKGGGWARGYEITVDGVGNVYATGRQSGSVDFDPGPGVAKSSGDAFVLKMAADGGFGWARSFAKSGGFAASIEPHGIGMDSFGNVYTTGGFWGNIDFNPGKAKFNLSSGVDQNGSSVGTTYVSALDSSGDFLWAKSAVGADAHGLALDGAANLYVTGGFTGAVDFDPGASTFNLTSAGGSDIFVWKLDKNGNFDWVAAMGGTGDDAGREIAVDASGNMFTTGYFASGPADFDPSPTGTYNLAGPGLFVSKLVQSPPLAMTLTAEQHTTTDTQSAVLSVASTPTSSTDSISQPTAPALLLAPPKSSAKNKLVDAALEDADASWFDGALDDDLLENLVRAG